MKCQDAVRNWIDEITKSVVSEAITDDKNSITYMTGIQYGTSEFISLDQGDFFFYIADIVVSAVQYGKRTDLCDIFKEKPDGNHTNLGVPAYTIEMKNFSDSVVGVGIDDYNRASPKFKDFLSSAYPWTYQFCTEFGFYQVPNRKAG